MTADYKKGNYRIMLLGIAILLYGQHFVTISPNFPVGSWGHSVVTYFPHIGLATVLLGFILPRVDS